MRTEYTAGISNQPDYLAPYISFTGDYYSMCKWAQENSIPEYAITRTVQYVKFPEEKPKFFVSIIHRVIDGNQHTSESINILKHINLRVAEEMSMVDYLSRFLNQAALLDLYSRLGLPEETPHPRINTDYAHAIYYNYLNRYFHRYQAMNEIMENILQCTPARTDILVHIEAEKVPN